MLSLTQFLSKLNNTARREQRLVVFPYSKVSFSLAQLLEREGFLQRVEKQISTQNVVKNKQSKFWVVLPTRSLRKIQQYSTCGRSIFWRLRDFRMNGFYVVSTSQGLLSQKEAFQKQVGGKVICRIF